MKTKRLSKTLSEFAINFKLLFLNDKKNTKDCQTDKTNDVQKQCQSTMLKRTKKI